MFITPIFHRLPMTYKTQTKLVMFGVLTAMIFSLSVAPIANAEVVSGSMTIPAICSAQIEDSDLAFGSLISGDESAEKFIDVSNDGNVIAQISLKNSGWYESGNPSNTVVDPEFTGSSATQGLDFDSMTPLSDTVPLELLSTLSDVESMYIKTVVEVNDQFFTGSLINDFTVSFACA